MMTKMNQKLINMNLRKVNIEAKLHQILEIRDNRLVIVEPWNFCQPINQSKVLCWSMKFQNKIQINIIKGHDKMMNILIQIQVKVVKQATNTRIITQKWNKKEAIREISSSRKVALIILELEDKTSSQNQLPQIRLLKIDNLLAGKILLWSPENNFDLNNS